MLPSERGHKMNTKKHSTNTIAKFSPLQLTFGLTIFLSTLSAAESQASDASEAAFWKVLNSIHSNRVSGGLPDAGDSTNNNNGGNTGNSGGTTSAQDYWVANVEPIVQSQCKVCHQEGGTADNSGARLLFTNVAIDNHQATEAFVSGGGGSADLVLSKIIGNAGHGGGRVLSEGSADYQAFESYFELLAGGSAIAPSSPSNFWADIPDEPRTQTLRRAALLLGGTLPSAGAVVRAGKSDEALRAEVLRIMRGDAFHDFLISGADDQLLTDGLMRGLDFDIQFNPRYPALAEFRRNLPEEQPTVEEGEFQRKPFLTADDTEWEARWAVHREPLELIAYVVETNRSYKEVLTADYTMVNPITNIAYRSGVAFEGIWLDEEGYLNRRLLNQFKPARNKGYVVQDEDNEFDFDTQQFVSYGDYVDVPHAGVLTSQAWLKRYPTTDTNRNRARARWTYLHFLDVDIEKSAPRTTDPVALADTDNPTLKNPACTVCHERMDPVAGAYQSFGDRGHYLEQWGGEDSLAESYKHPEWFGGEPGDTPYQDGDTWYRDMRVPGFEGDEASGNLDSLQWLARQIVEDPRFASATVKFWWPAIFGAEPLTAPEDPEGPNYQQRLNAYNAQEALVAELADKFVASGFKAKELFADMILSPWYRAEVPGDSVTFDTRGVELATVGRGRLLTPEELDRKNKALFGRTWGQQGRWQAHEHYPISRLGEVDYASYKGFYGGTDSAVVTVRNRDMTPVMSNVSESMATDFACQAVGYEFSQPQAARRVFTLVERDTVPGNIFRESIKLPGKVSDGNNEWTEQDPIIANVTLGKGLTRIKIQDTTQNGWDSNDGENTNADIIVQSVTFKQNDRTVLSVDGRKLESQSGFDAETWQRDDGQIFWRGDANDSRWGWRMHENAWVALNVDLAAGTYTVEVVLATVLQENNVNDEMTASISLSAVDNVNETATGKAVLDQLKALYLATTNQQLSDARAIELSEKLVAHAKEHGRRNWNWAGCDVWPVFGFDELPDDSVDWDDPEIQAIFADPEGMIMGWTMITHSIMSSYGYLHD